MVHAKPRSSSLNQPQFSWSSKAWTLAPQKYAQGRFGVLKEIVVSDKCSSTALSVYKGSILELRYIPVTKCGWECEQCSHTFFGHFQAADVSVVSSYPSLNAKWRKSTPTSDPRIYDQDQSSMYYTTTYLKQFPLTLSFYSFFAGKNEWQVRGREKCLKSIKIDHLSR